MALFIHFSPLTKLYNRYMADIKKVKSYIYKNYPNGFMFMPSITNTKINYIYFEIKKAFPRYFMENVSFPVLSF